MIAVVEIQETRQGLVRVSGRMLNRPKGGYKKTSRQEDKNDFKK